MDQKGIDDMSQVASANPNDNFEKLAPELLFPILIQLPDLESLDNLLQVSPAACRLFDLRGVEIFETILSSDTNTHEYSRGLIRIIALLRSSALPVYVHNWISFKDLITFETTSYRYKPPRWEHPPLRLPPYTSMKALREVLATNQRIQRLTIDCLRYYLDKFKPLRPSHLADESFVYKSQDDPSDANYVGQWQLNPVEVPYPVQDVGEPSWLEQQRVLRAFWRIQLFLEFQEAIGTLCITWPEEDLSRIRWMVLNDLYDVNKFIKEDDCWYKVIGEIEPRLSETDTLLEYELIESAVDFLQEGRETIDEPTYQQLKIEWKSCPQPSSGDDYRHHDALDDCITSPMWYFFHQLKVNTTGTIGSHDFDTHSPLQHVHFTPFRRLGFAIWSQARLQGYGLLQFPLPQTAEFTYVRWSKHAPVYTAWKSVLTADERAEVATMNEWWVDLAMNSQPFDLDAHRRREQASMMLEEEEMGPPVVDWAEHYRRQKRRILSGMKDEDVDVDEVQDDHVEDGEVPGSVDIASGL
jgi:hypothetical protein